MTEQTYYKAVEYFEDGTSIVLMENFNQRFKTYEEAMQAVDKAILGRKKQYSYFRNKDGVIVEKISFSERHRLEYKIFKVKEQREELYSIDNRNLELKKPRKDLQEETPLTL